LRRTGADTCRLEQPVFRIPSTVQPRSTTSRAVRRSALVKWEIV
jgi:hypothetical protein